MSQQLERKQAQYQHADQFTLVRNAPRNPRPMGQRPAARPTARQDRPTPSSLPLQVGVLGVNPYLQSKAEEAAAAQAEEAIEEGSIVVGSTVAGSTAVAEAPPFPELAGEIGEMANLEIAIPEPPATTLTMPPTAPPTPPPAAPPKPPLALSPTPPPAAPPTPPPAVLPLPAAVDEASPSAYVAPSARVMALQVIDSRRQPSYSLLSQAPGW